MTGGSSSSRRYGTSAMGLPSVLRLLLAGTALVPFGLGAAFANPLGGNVVSGNATIHGTGTNHVVINQTSQNAVINWQSFNIGLGQITRFNQPNSTSTVLNRVFGDPNPSQILGTLTANGRVFVINPNGILIGNGAVINTAGFLATTHDISNKDFMDGRYNFNIPGRPTASIVNLGTITATNAGFAALVAPGVRNAGTITATFGKIALASANKFTLDPYGDKLITLSISDRIAAQIKDVATGQTLRSLVQNDGKLQANGGRVELTAAAARQVVDSVINNTGVIEARSIGQRQGKIVLAAATAATKGSGAPRQTVKVSGTLTVAGDKTRGGTILVTGEHIEVTGARLDASGATGGGKVLIGGDVGGGKPSPLVKSMLQARLEDQRIATATSVIVDGATVIDVSATASGNAGKVVVWADGAMTFGGNITARGGPLGGNGGFVEVSGKQMLSFAGKVNVGAPRGDAGTLLLDPLNAIVANTPGPGVILASAIQAALAFGDVLITTNNFVGNQLGNLIVNAPITWATAHNLWLSAYRNVIINANITNTYTGLTGGGHNKHMINILADNTGTGTGTVMFGTGAIIKTSGEINIAFNPTGSGPKYANVNEDFSNHVDLTGGGKLNHHYLVNTPSDLQAISNNLNANYVLGRDINMAGITNFVPIGNGNTFNGSLFGLGHTISNLTINSPLANVGLFSRLGSNAEISRLNLVNFNVVSTSTGYNVNVGVVAGWNAGNIFDVLIAGASVTATGTLANSINLGGVVGYNSGRIEHVTAAAVAIEVPGASSGTLNAGILAGQNGIYGNIMKSMVLGGFIENHATGGSVSLGLAVGHNQASIEKVVTAGVITDDNDMATIGGVVGTNDVGGTIRETLAIAGLDGGAAGQVGGIAGVNLNQSYSPAPIVASYWNSDLFNGPGVGNDARGNPSGTAPLTTAAILSGTLPAGFDPQHWIAQPGIFPLIKPPTDPQLIVNPTLPNPNPDPPPITGNVLTNPPIANNAPPPPSNDPPLVLIALRGPPPAGTGAAGGTTLGGSRGPTTYGNASPGQPGYVPPPLPQRTVAGPDGETASSMPPLGENRFIQNQVLMQLNLDIADAELARIVQQFGIRVVETDTLSLHGRRMFRLLLPAGMTVRRAIQLLELNRLVSVVAPIYRHVLMQPAAAAHGRGDPAQYMLGKLQLDKAHEVATGKGVTIAVIDSEPDKNHAEIKGAISEELDALGASQAPHAHGTAMVGAIASRDRLLGVAPGARILAVRAFGEANNSAEGTTISIIKGIEWAVSQGARVINMSFAGPRDPALERALKAAREKGVVLVAAAGNAGPKSPPLFPAADPNVIAVTATDVRDRPFRGANQGPQVSVAAPGVEILAPAPEEAYQMSTGTSIATAHVSGVVALMLERDPTLTPAEVRKILEETAIDLGPKGKDAQFGWGLVNPQKALEVVNARPRKTSELGRR
jgi:filamentous hemagglutinin family protein